MNARGSFRPEIEGLRAVAILLVESLSHALDEQIGS